MVRPETVDPWRSPRKSFGGERDWNKVCLGGSPKIKSHHFPLQACRPRIRRLEGRRLRNWKYGRDVITTAELSWCWMHYALQPIPYSLMCRTSIISHPAHFSLPPCENAISRFLVHRQNAGVSNAQGRCLLATFSPRCCVRYGGERGLGLLDLL